MCKLSGMNLKLLLKRGALVAAANWQIIAIQFVAETTFQVLLAVPIIGAAVLVATLLGGDLAEILGGSLREIFASIARALMSEPVALATFMAAFGIVLLGGSALLFLVKGGTVQVLLAAETAAGPIEREPLTYETTIRATSRFTLQSFMDGCRRMFRRYLTLGAALMVIYAVSGVAYVAFVVYGYQAAGDRFLIIGWTFVAALAGTALVGWITFVNWLYLLLQIAMALEDVGLGGACRAVVGFVRSEFRDLTGVFGVILALLVGATLASALAWSGVGLIAFVPLVGLAVFPLQIAALLLRGLLFEYIGLTALASYAALYHRHMARAGRVVDATLVRSRLLKSPA
jgi:hypothetical protein